MKKIICLILIAVLFQPVSAQLTKSERLEQLFDSIYRTGQFSGNVLIAENGKPLYQHCFGMADEKTKIPLNADTRFLIGSVSKQFTAMGIVLLKIAGKLNYEDTLGKFIPELPYYNITIRQMLQHSSGLPDYGPLMQQHWDNQKFAGNADMINMLIKHKPPVFFAPGERYLYSNTGYALLATIIERVSGQSFPDYMEQKVFAPLGMNHTIIYTRRYHPRKVRNYATGYVYIDSLQQFGLPEEHPVWKNALWEDGIYGEDGVNPTVGDMLIWNQTLYNKRFIPASEIDTIFTPDLPRIGTSDQGFGWRIQKKDSLGRIVFHSGGWPGYIAYNEQHLDHNRTIIILRNRFTPQTRMPIDAIRTILAGN